MAYRSVPEGYDFSTEFPTWIIAYCPDTDTWFCTNNRFFYYEYPDEFQCENDGVNYFTNHIDEFVQLHRKMTPWKINKDVVFLENTKKEYYEAVK